MNVTSIIISYNTADFISSCIDSLLMQKDIEQEIIVIDNASKDHSKKILEAYNDKIKLYINTENVGFGKACNQAFAQSKGEFIYLINPDVKLTKPDDLKKLIEFAAAKPSIGLIGTNILNNNGTRNGYFIPDSYPGQKKIKQDFNHLPGNIAYLICASVLLHRNIYEKIAGFDEDFFVYGEDLDICLRIRKKGYEIAFFEEVTAQHIGNISERKTGNYQRYLRRMQSLYTFYRKHYFIDEVKNLLKKDLFKSRLSLLILHLNKLIAPRSVKIQDKIDRYKAIKQVALENLSN